MLFSTTTTQQENHQNTTTHTTTTTTKKIKYQRERVKNQNHTKMQIGSWVDQNHTKNQNHTHTEIDSWVRGAKALGRRRSRRLMGQRLWVEDRFVGSQISSQIGEVEGVIWALGSWRDLGSLFFLSLSLSLSLRVNPKMV